MTLVPWIVILKPQHTPARICLLLFWIMLGSLAKPWTTKTSNGTCLCMSISVTIVLCRMAPQALLLLPTLTRLLFRPMCKQTLLFFPVTAELLEEWPANKRWIIFWISIITNAAHQSKKMTHSITLRMSRKNKKEQIAANDNAKHRRLSETDGDTVFNLLQSFWDHLSTTASNPPCYAQYSSGDSLSLNIILLSASLRIHVLHAWEWPLRVHNAIVDLQPAGLLRGRADEKSSQLAGPPYSFASRIKSVCFVMWEVLSVLPQYLSLAFLALLEIASDL